MGEVLWDSLPAGLYIGGAPFNVACHLRALGIEAGFVSRVGADRLGNEALRRIAERGLDPLLVQRDPVLPTGFVEVALDSAGEPEYDIVAPAAWDALEVTEDLLERAAGARALVYGSLAQRTEGTRATLERLTRGPALKVFDVNLRPPHDDPQVVRQSLERADLVKLNNRELQRMASWFGLAGSPNEVVPVLASRFDLKLVCVTLGGNGAVLWHHGRWSEHPGFQVQVNDTVGAGDAFLAGLLAGVLEGQPDSMLLEQANLMGAFVASQPGAVPRHRPGEMARILALPPGGGSPPGRRA